MLAVILCGGSGTRLWPVSARSHAQALHEDWRGPLAAAADRASGCTVRRERLPRRHERRVHVQDDRRDHRAGRKGPAELQLVLEPVGRNTAPAIAAACCLIETQGRANEPLIVLPADHLIQDEARFANVAARAAKLAAAGRIVLFGSGRRCPRPALATSSARDPDRRRAAVGPPLRRKAIARKSHRVPRRRKLPLEQWHVLFHRWHHAGRAQAARSGCARSRPNGRRARIDADAAAAAATARPRDVPVGAGHLD